MYSLNKYDVLFIYPRIYNIFYEKYIQFTLKISDRIIYVYAYTN